MYSVVCQARNSPGHQTLSPIYTHTHTHKRPRLAPGSLDALLHDLGDLVLNLTVAGTRLAIEEGSKDTLGNKGNGKGLSPSQDRDGRCKKCREALAEGMVDV